MDPEETEFVAENNKISILPTFNSGTIHLVGGDYGPFRASLPVNVPLWVAINLKTQQKCKIQPPDWMDVQKLEELKENEKQTPTFTKMPSEHYMVEAKLLLGHAFDDIPNADEVKTIIKDIWDIRMSKLRASVDKLVKGLISSATLDHLTLMEINTLRPIVPHALDQLYRLRNVGAQPSQNTTFGGSTSLNTTT